LALQFLQRALCGILNLFAERFSAFLATIRGISTTFLEITIVRGRIDVDLLPVD
jgi:hypothetical protein